MKRVENSTIILCCLLGREMRRKHKTNTSRYQAPGTPKYHGPSVRLSLVPTPIACLFLYSTVLKQACYEFCKGFMYFGTEYGQGKFYGLAVSIVRWNHSWGYFHSRVSQVGSATNRRFGTQEPAHANMPLLLHVLRARGFPIYWRTSIAVESSTYRCPVAL